MLRLLPVRSQSDLRSSGWATSAVNAQCGRLSLCQRRRTEGILPWPQACSVLCPCGRRFATNVWQRPYGVGKLCLAHGIHRRRAEGLSRSASLLFPEMRGRVLTEADVTMVRQNAAECFGASPESCRPWLESRNEDIPVFRGHNGAWLSDKRLPDSPLSVHRGVQRGAAPLRFSSLPQDWGSGG